MDNPTLERFVELDPTRHRFLVAYEVIEPDHERLQAFCAGDLTNFIRNKTPANHADFWTVKNQSGSKRWLLIALYLYLPATVDWSECPNINLYLLADTAYYYYPGLRIP